MTWEMKWAQLQTQHTKHLSLTLAPLITKMPLPMLYSDDPFLPFSKAVIDATRVHVSVYCFDLARYLALGAAGAIALERAIAYANTDRLTWLEVCGGGEVYVNVGQGFGADFVALPQGVRAVPLAEADWYVSQQGDYQAQIQHAVEAVYHA
jgi:hypothetical protein